MFNWFKKKTKEDIPSVLSSVGHITIKDYESFRAAFKKLDKELVNLRGDEIHTALLLLGLQSTTNGLSRVTSSYSVLGLLTYKNLSLDLMKILEEIESFSETKNSEITNFVNNKRRIAAKQVDICANEASQEINLYVKNFMETENKVLNFK